MLARSSSRSIWWSTQAAYKLRVHLVPGVQQLKPAVAALERDGAFGRPVGVGVAGGVEAAFPLAQLSCLTGVDRRVVDRQSPRFRICGSSSERDHQLGIVSLRLCDATSAMA